MRLQKATPSNATPAHICRRQQTDVGVDHEAPRARFAALSPVQIVASGEVRIGHFDVAKFAKTVGPFAKVSCRRPPACRKARLSCAMPAHFILIETRHGNGFPSNAGQFFSQLCE